MVRSRSSRFELLRTLAILGIVIMHVNGDLMASAQGSAATWIQIENSLFDAGVSGFVLISGVTMAFAEHGKRPLFLRLPQ